MKLKGVFGVFPGPESIHNLQENELCFLEESESTD